MEAAEGADGRWDEKRLFERRLLASAPGGLLPDSLQSSPQF